MAKKKKEQAPDLSKTATENGYSPNGGSAPPPQGKPLWVLICKTYIEDENGSHTLARLMQNTDTKEVRIFE